MTRARDLADSADKDIAGTVTLDVLGIGTSSPTGLLDLSATTGSGTLNIISTVNATNAGNKIAFFGANRSDTDEEMAYIKPLLLSNSGGSGNVQEGHLTFGTSGNEAMRISSGGDVSFSGSSGTVGTVKGNGTVTISDNHGSNNGGGLAFHYTGNGGYSQVYVKNNNTLVIDADPTAAGSSTNIEFNIDGSEAMRIDSSGNVGIGTSSPSNVIETAYSDSELYSTTSAKTTGSALRILNDSSITGSYSALKLHSKNVNGTVGQWDIASISTSTNYDNDLAFATRTGSSTYAERMRIDSSGNVGIGTAAPAYHLHLDKDTNDDGLFIGSTSNTENKRIVFGTAGSIGKAAIATRNNATFGRKHLDFHINIAADNTTDIDYSSNPCLALMDGNRMAMNSQTETSVSYTHRFYINDDRTGSTSAPLGLRFGSTATRRQINFMNPNGIVGRIQTSGSATSYVTSSDYRLKENVVDITDGIERVKQLLPKRFNFIADADLTVDGFIAHETQTVVPEAIDGVKDETQAVGNVLDAAGEIVEAGTTEPEELEEGYTWTATGSEPVYQGIDQSKIVPVLTAALKEAIAKIEALEARLDALEAE